MKKASTILVMALLLTVLVSACGPAGPTPKPVPTNWGAELKGQPAYPFFPEPGQHWVIDQGCHFAPDKISWADQVLEQLRLDGYAEVAVLCVTGVKDLGGTNNGLIWLMEWTRHVRLGNAKDDRSVAFLIRPDINPNAGDRVIEQPSIHLTQVTVLDLAPIVTNAADWANQGQYDGALTEIVKDVNIVLRKRIQP